MVNRPLTRSLLPLTGALLLVGCQTQPLDLGPSEPEPCEDAANPVVADCDQDEHEPNEDLEDAHDLLGESGPQVGVACATDVDLWWIDDRVPLEWSEVRVTVEWDSCDATLEVQALNSGGGELTGISGGGGDSERRQSLHFPAGSLAYVQVANPDSAQGPVRYTISYELFVEDDD